jgi:uncharacterized integral membrane protein (TIGR00697 family)
MVREKTDFKYLTLVSGLFVSTLLVSNTISQKPLQWGPFIAPAGIILFPMTYIFGDVLTEVYGYARARQVIWTGFLGNGVMVISYWTVIRLPFPSFWAQQEALHSVLTPVPRLVIASMAGYLAGEFVNSFVLAKMKVFTQGRYLWTRTIGSTLAGQFVDTLLFVLAGFTGVWPLGQLAWVAVSLYFLKVSYEVLATPLTYAAVNFLKREEGIDCFDRTTRFTPFQWSA